jgi:hypothetical protein
MTRRDHVAYPSSTTRLQRRRGSVSIFSALSFVALIAIADLATEYGYCLALKVSSQRAADATAYAGALGYAAGGTTAAMSNQATQIAALNGLSTGVSVSLGNSPTGDGNSAVSATVTDTYVRQLQSLYGLPSSLRPTSSAAAEIAGGTPGCVFAMSKSGTGITLSGGVSATITGCAVESNVSVTAPCGTLLTAQSVTYVGTAPVANPSGCTTIAAPTGKTLSMRKVAAVDPVAGTTALSTSESRSSTVGSLVNPAAPTVSGGTSLDFSYSPQAAEQALTAAGCTYTYSQPTYTVNCTTPNKTYTFGSLTVEGGITLTFNTVASSTYNFSGLVNTQSSPATFGSGTFNLGGGLEIGGGGTGTFGGGTFNIGGMSCNGSQYSICVGGGAKVSFNGTVNMNLQDGLFVQGGSSATIGTGSNNSYVFGSGSSGYAIYSSGGANFILADATGSGDVFQMNGSIGNGGGSCTIIPAATQHDINGFVSTSGGTYFGAGSYTVSDYVGVGVNSGGDVTCTLPSTGASQTVGFYAANTTWYAAGNQLISSWSCNQGAATALCIGAGYANVVISAPSSGSVANLAFVSTAGGVAVTEGASNTVITGVLYTPNNPITLSGGANVSGGSGGGTNGSCLEIVGSSITLSGGSTLASSCPGFTGSATSATSKLVN